MKKLSIILSLASLLLGVSTVPVYAHNTENGDKDKDLLRAKITLAASSTTTVNPVCMQSAVEKRETALIASIDTYHDSVRAALLVRKDGLKAALAITDNTARKEALMKTRITWRNALKDAQKVFRQSKKSIWHNFEIDRKACGAASEGISSRIDLQL